MEGRCVAQTKLAEALILVKGGSAWRMSRQLSTPRDMHFPNHTNWIHS